MRRTRILVVDDSVVIRRMLREVLLADPTLEIAGVAANGKIALSLVEHLQPDLITLDIEMPEMDGLETLRVLRVRYPKLPVIMFSTLTERGASATLDALALGARDYVTKPINVSSIESSKEYIARELLPKIKGLCRPEKFEIPISLCTKWKSNLISGNDGAVACDAVVIGTSTGGPNALADVLPRLPADLPVPVVVVQHMPPTFTRFLAERLNANCALEVAEAGHDQVLLPGKIWIAPGDYHIAICRDGTRMRLYAHKGQPENSCRPSVDVLFRSAAENYGRNTLAVIMTGMGQDGLRGAEELRAVGARIVAQDEATSVVWGMPGFVVQAGLADRVLPLSQIGNEITRHVMEAHKVHA